MASKSHEETLITSFITHLPVSWSSPMHHVEIQNCWIPRETLICFSYKFWFHLTESYRWKLCLAHRKPLRFAGCRPSVCSNWMGLLVSGRELQTWPRNSWLIYSTGLESHICLKSVYCEIKDALLKNNNNNNKTCFIHLQNEHQPDYIKVSRDKQEAQISGITSEVNNAYFVQMTEQQNTVSSPFVCSPAEDNKPKDHMSSVSCTYTCKNKCYNVKWQ